MSDPKRNPLKKENSRTSLEQSLKMISPPQQAPITIYPGPSSGMAGLSKADLDIAQRLESLRKSHTEAVPTEEEMASRLAQLKGLPVDHYSKPNAGSAVYQRPDTRTQGQQSEDLLKQAMEEVSLDARLPKPEDELEARLARLRGEEPRPPQPQGAVALPPNLYYDHSPSRDEANLGEALDDITMDEVEALMREAEKENAAAGKAMADLQANPELMQAVAQATRKKDKKKSHQKKSKSADRENADTSDEERYSKSFDSDTEIEGGKAIDAVTEQEEVQRIIDMYTKRAQLKKEKKRKKREAAAAAAEGAGAVGGEEDSDSDIEVSSDSDHSSEGEKFSASDELSD